MMESVRAYLISVVSAAIVSALIIQIVGNKGTYSAIIKLLTGLFLSITVMSPFLKINVNDLDSYFESVQTDASNAVYDGTMAAKNKLIEIIKDNTEAYILDKAESMGLSINVSVSITEAPAPEPKSVIIEGTASPTARLRLQEMIEEDLAIPKEYQLWK